MNSSITETLKQFLYSVVTVISLFIILTYLFSMVLGILIIFTTGEGLDFASTPYPIYPLLIFDIEVNLSGGWHFLLLWGIFTLCFAVSWKYKENFLSKIKAHFSDTPQSNPFSNSLLAMPLITSMLLIATIVIDYLQTQGGIPSGDLFLGDPFEALLKVSWAPVIEEVLFRIIPLGTLLVAYTFFAGKKMRPHFSWSQRVKTSILSILQPEKAKETIGLRTIEVHGVSRGVIWAEWIIIISTAVLFGIAHYFSGWGFGKISQATLIGVVFALAYLYFGIQAPVLLHWFFNYYFNVFNLSSNYYSGVNFIYFAAASTNFFLGVLMWIVVIILSILAVASRVLKAHRRVAIPDGMQSHGI